MKRSVMWSLVVVAGAVLSCGNAEAKIWKITSPRTGFTVSNNGPNPSSPIPATGTGPKQGTAILEFGTSALLVPIIGQFITEGIAPVVADNNGRWAATINGPILGSYTVGTNRLLLLRPTGSGKVRTIGGFTVVP